LALHESKVDSPDCPPHEEAEEEEQETKHIKADEQPRQAAPTQPYECLQQYLQQRLLTSSASASLASSRSPDSNHSQNASPSQELLSRWYLDTIVKRFQSGNVEPSNGSNAEEKEDKSKMHLEEDQESPAALDLSRNEEEEAASTHSGGSSTSVNGSGGAASAMLTGASVSAPTATPSTPSAMPINGKTATQATPRAHKRKAKSVKKIERKDSSAGCASSASSEESMATGSGGGSGGQKGKRLNFVHCGVAFRTLAAAAAPSSFLIGADPF